MALNYDTNPTFTGRITAADANYPYGSSKDESAPGANDGMPHIKQRADDLLGFQQALLEEGDVTPSGSADTAIASQYLEAAKKILKSGRKNYVINGGFNIWQRATSQTSDGYGSDDRWLNSSNGSTKVHSQQAFALGQTAVPGNPEFYSRTVVTSVANAANQVSKTQRIEKVGTLAGREVMLSFWAKADAAKDISTEFAQVFGTGGSPSGTVTGIGVVTHSLTTSWQKFTATATISSVSGKTLGTGGDDSFQVTFWFDAGSDFDARSGSLGQQSGTFDISQVQIEEGDVNTEFEFRPIAEEKALCERYYCHAYNNGASNGTTIGNATRGHFCFPTTMRAVPTVTKFTELVSDGYPATETYQNLTVEGGVSNRVADAGVSSGNQFTSIVAADAEL